MDWLAVIEKVGAPVVTGLGGFVGAALNFKRRMEQLEIDFTAFKEAITKEHAAIREAYKKEIDWVKGDLEEDLKKLQGELEELQETFQSFQRGSVSDFADADEMQRFVEEQGRQWQQIQRTLGQIEGLIKRVPSAPPPPMQRPPTPSVARPAIRPLRGPSNKR